MASGSDLRDNAEALTEIIEQADLALATIRDPQPSLASVHESIKAALALSCDVVQRVSELLTASSMGEKGGASIRDQKAPGYFRELAKARKTRADGPLKKNP